MRLCLKCRLIKYVVYFECWEHFHSISVSAGKKSEIPIKQWKENRNMVGLILFIKTSFELHGQMMRTKNVCKFNSTLVDKIKQKICCLYSFFWFIIILSFMCWLACIMIWMILIKFIFLNNSTIIKGQWLGAILD